MAAITRIRSCYEKLGHLNVLKLYSGNVGRKSSCLLHTTSPKLGTLDYYCVQNNFGLIQLHISLTLVVEINMPSLSPTMADGTIISWQKRVGDAINPGDVLCEIQTDKAVMAFETEEEGVLAKIYVHHTTILLAFLYHN